MTLAAVLLGIAALGGATLLALRMRGGGNPPLGLALLHGLLAGSGVVALAVAVVVNRETGAPLVSLGLFVLGAGAGSYLFSLHLRGRLIPIGVAWTHAFVVGFAYVLLLAHLLG